MTPIHWTEGAVADLERIRAYLSAIDPRSAQRLADRLIAATQALGPSSDAVTEVPVTYPYLIRCRCDADAILIDAVRHASCARIV